MAWSEGRGSSSGEPSRVLVLTLLIAVISLNIIDRQVIGILSEPIKQELKLSDMQLGLLTGLAFSLFYSAIGIPIAHFADRGDRVKILAAATFAWSLMTGLGALAINYLTLLLARAGVAVGEAGCNPTTQSLIADYFPPERRGLAQGLLVTSIPLSSLAALALGGIVADALGWRWTLIIAAVPGLLLAPLVWRILPEPRRLHAAEARAPGNSMYSEIVSLMRKKDLVLLIAAATFSAVQTYAMFLWVPSFFMRSFNWSLTTAGVGLGFAVGIGGVIGSVAAGWFADRLRGRQFGGQIAIPGLAAIISIPLLLTMLLSNDSQLAIGAFFLIQTVTVAGAPALYAALQDFAPAGNRALAFALLSLAANLIGMGIGPLALGQVSDWLAPTLGARSLQYALLLCVATQALAAVFYLATFRNARSSGQGPIKTKLL